MSVFYLREIVATDVVAINSWKNDPDIMGALCTQYRYVSSDLGQPWLQNYFENRDKDVRLAICEKSKDILIGMVCLHRLDWVSRSAEFSIMIGEKEYQAQGAGTFATRKMLDHAFFNLNLHRVFLTVMPNNDRAIALYRKTGFIEEGTLRESLFKDGNYISLFQMSILSHEFKDNHLNQ